MSGTQRWCGVCKRWTEQTYIETSDKWSCDICKTITVDSLGCRISFTVQGKAVAKERPRATVRGGYAVMYTPKNTAQFEVFVKQVASSFKPPKLLSGALEMVLAFYIQRPQSLSQKINYDVKKPDVDNLAKSIMDALEGVIYEHDSQVISLQVRKGYGSPRVDIVVEELPEK